MIKEFNNNKISPIQYSALIVFLSNSFFIGIGMPNILKISKNDSYISIIIGYIISIPLLLLISYMNKHNTNIFNILNKYFNKFFKKIIEIIFIIFVLFSLITILNDFINFANLKYLFETSNVFIAIIFVLPMIYIISKNIESIGRASLVLFSIIIIIHIINSSALIKYVDIENLKPILQTNFKDIILSAFYYVIYSILPIIFLSAIPKNDDYKKYNKSLFIGYTISFIFIFSIIFYITTVYNYKYITLFSYPAYFTIKKIEYGFISHAENILSFEFIINYFFTTMVLMYILFYYFKNIIHTNKTINKIINIIIILLVIILPVIYKSTILARIISEKYFLLINSFIMIIYFIIIPIKIRLKKKKN